MTWSNILWFWEINIVSLRNIRFEFFLLRIILLFLMFLFLHSVHHFHQFIFIFVHLDHFILLSNWIVVHHVDRLLSLLLHLRMIKFFFFLFRIFLNLTLLLIGLLPRIKSFMDSSYFCHICLNKRKITTSCLLVPSFWHL